MYFIPVFMLYQLAFIEGRGGKVGATAYLCAAAAVYSLLLLLLLPSVALLSLPSVALLLLSNVATAAVQCR